MFEKIRKISPVFIKGAASLILAIAIVWTIIVIVPPVSDRIRAGDDVKVKVSENGFSLEVFSKRVSDLRAAKATAGETIAKLDTENWPDWATKTIGQRAERTYSILFGKTILWIDDLHPTQNVVERRLLRTIGLNIDSVRCQDDAKKMLSQERYYAVIVESSVFKSSGDNCKPPEKGLEPGKVYRSEFVDWLRVHYPEIPIIAYSATIGTLKKDNGVPPGLFGATKFTSELFHLVIDALERIRQ